jgi:hypothetical protein
MPKESTSPMMSAPRSAPQKFSETADDHDNEKNR